jgi:hypothetical protein
MCGYVACVPECSGSVRYVTCVPECSGSVRYVACVPECSGSVRYVACVPECSGSVHYASQQLVISTTHIFLSSDILSISLYTTACKLKTLNNSTVLTSAESINRIIKKVSIIILKISVQNVPSSVKVGSFFDP